MIDCIGWSSPKTEKEKFVISFRYSQLRSSGSENCKNG